MPKNKQSDRARIDFNLGDPNVQSQMQARDTYVAPGRVTFGKPVGQGSDLMALGKSLGVGLQKYQAYDNKQTKNMIETQTAKAQADFQLNRKGFKKAVEDGDIPEGANPHYIRAYQQTELGNIADQFASDLEVKMNEEKLWEHTNGNDISDVFTNYKNEKLNEFMQENNIQGRFSSLDIARVLAPKIQKMEVGLLNKVTDLNIKFNEKEGIRVASQKIRTVAEKFAVGDYSDLELPWNGGKPDEGAAKTGMIKYFENYLNDPEEGLIATGMSGQKANETLARTLLSMARDTVDTDWLDILQGVKGQGGASIAKILSISELVTSTKSFISQKEQTNIKFKEYLRRFPKERKMFDMKYDHIVNQATFDNNRLFFDEKKREKLTEAEWTDVLSGSWQLVILSDPDALTKKGKGSWNDPWLVAEMNKLDPDMRKKIISSTLQIRKDMNSHEGLKYYTPPKEQSDNYMGLYGKIIDPDGGNQMTHIEESYRQQKITESQYEKLRQAQLDVNMLDHQLYKSPMYDHLNSQIEGHFSNVDREGDYSIPGLGKVSMAGLKLRTHMVAYEFMKERARAKGVKINDISGAEVIKDTQAWLQGILVNSPLPGQTVKEGATPKDTDPITKDSMNQSITGKALTPDNPGFSPEETKQMDETKTNIKDNLEILRTIENPEMFADLYQKGQKILENFKPVPGDPKATQEALDNLKIEIRLLGDEGKARVESRTKVTEEINKFANDPEMKDYVKPFIEATKQPNVDWINLGLKAERLQELKDKILKAKEEQKELKRMEANKAKKKKKEESERQKKLKEIERETKANESLTEIENMFKKKK